MLTEFRRQPVSFVRVGGALGIAGTLLGILVFLAATGFSAALIFGPLVALFGLTGLIITVLGAARQPPTAADETQPIVAMFVSFLSLLAGLLKWMMH